MVEYASFHSSSKDKLSQVALLILMTGHGVQQKLTNSQISFQVLRSGVIVTMTVLMIKDSQLLEQGLLVRLGPQDMVTLTSVLKDLQDQTRIFCSLATVTLMAMTCQAWSETLHLQQERVPLQQWLQLEVKPCLVMYQVVVLTLSEGVTGMLLSFKISLRDQALVLVMFFTIFSLMPT